MPETSHLHTGVVLINTNPDLDPDVYHLSCVRESTWVDKGDVTATLCGRELPDYDIERFNASRADVSGLRLCAHCRTQKQALLDD